MTDDPWFSAHKPLDARTSTGLFFADAPAGILGCATSRLFCSFGASSAMGCVNAFSPNLWMDFKRTWPNPDDQASLMPLAMILHQLDAADIGELFRVTSLPTLLARHTVMGSVQHKYLPRNQWQLEMEYITQTMLAAMQHYMVDYARGFWGRALDCKTSPCRRLCGSQVWWCTMREWGSAN
jgi:hypothetical protein